MANLFADQNCDVVLWGRNEEVVRAINEKHENTKYLSKIPLSPRLKATTDLVTALKSADTIVCSVPTQQIRAVFGTHQTLFAEKRIVNTSKGIELGTHLRVSEIFGQLAPKAKYFMLSGPTFALEIAKRLPGAATIASTSKEEAIEIQQLLSNNYFRVYTSKDVVGVELAGALKNVVAIATGIVSGLNLGYNAQAAIINRGIAELLRVGKKLGADPFTFLGLAGTGDLILTCTGPLSRNRTLGIKLGQGTSLPAIQKELGGVAEGVYTAKSALELAESLKIEMPITEQVYKILYEGRSPQQALVDLMSRDLKSEWDIASFK